MRRETALFVEAVIREDRSVLDFIDAPFTYLNGPLARHYGIAGLSTAKSSAAWSSMARSAAAC